MTRGQMLLTVSVLTNIWSFLLPGSQRIVFLLCSARMDHETASDQKNTNRSNNCNFLAEAVKSPCEIIYFPSSLSQRPEKGVSVHLGPCAFGGPP